MINKNDVYEKEIILVNEDKFADIAKHIEKIEIENEILKNELEKVKIEKDEFNKKMNFKLVKYAYKLTMLKRRFLR